MLFGRRSLVAATVLAALSSGCGTVDNIRRPVMPAPNSTNAQVCRVYGGVRGHWDAITDYSWHETPCVLDYALLPVMAAVDLGLSAVGDTFTLPYTVGAEVWRLFHRQDAPSEPFSVVVPGGPAAEPGLVPSP